MSVHYDKPRRVWYTRWRDSQGTNRIRRFGAGPQGKRDAQAYDYEIKRAKKLGDQLPQITGRGIYLDELAQLWINAKIAQGRSPGWITDWANLLQKYFLPHLTARPVEEYTYDELVTFVSQRYPALVKHPISPSTRNRYLNYLKMMFNFGVDHEHLRTNPLRRWRAPNEPPRQTMLTVADLREIFNVAPPHLQWALEVEWNLGVRAGVSELLSLQWQMIDWHEGYIRVFGQKTRKWRKVPLDPGFLLRLQEMRAKGKTQYLIEYRGRPVKKFRRSLATACAKAGINYSVCMTDIRHLFITALLQGGADLKAVSEIAGHSSTKMTADQYYFYLEGEKRLAIAKLPPIHGEQSGEQNVLQTPVEEPISNDDSQ